MKYHSKKVANQYECIDGIGYERMPGRKSEYKRHETWENIYTLMSANGHDYFHERFLRPYKGHIPENSPLMFMRGIAADEINLREI